MVWVTTTTHLGTDQVVFADRHVILHSVEEIEKPQLDGPKVTLITGAFTADDRVSGLDAEALKKILRVSERKKISIILEADGSRSVPLKAPADHEPAIPDWVDTVIVVAGLSVLGKPFTSQWVYRPDHFGQVTTLKAGQPLTMESICQMMVHPAGGLKNIPRGAQRIVLFNQADTVEIRSEVRKWVSKLLEGGFDKVISGSLGKDPDHLERYSKGPNDLFPV